MAKLTRGWVDMLT